MQSLPEMDVIKRALRSRICPQCHARPTGSEQLSPDQPRSCEPGCSIFLHLPRVRDIVMTVHDPSLGPYEHALVENVCEKSCDVSATAGDFCAERSVRRCPLATYAGQVVEVIERVHGRKHAG